MRVEILYNDKGDKDVYYHVETLMQLTHFLVIRLKGEIEPEKIEKKRINMLTIYDKEWEDEE